MNPEIITRVVGLVKSQGDRVVLADSATGKVVVIISLDEYERLSLGHAQEVAARAPATIPAPASTPPAAQPVPASVTRPAFSYTPAPERIVPLPAPPPAIRPAVEPRVEAPVKAPEIIPKPATEAPQKLAQPSDNPFKQKAQQLGVKTPQKPASQSDLTQAELLDKINREIGDWKTAQERKRAEELTSVARTAPVTAPDSPVEEEERFYLEPIE